jgi:hypothetical protein
MEFPYDIFKEIVSFTGNTKTKVKKVFEVGENYYKWRNELMIFKVLKRTKCFVVLKVVQGSSPYHKEGEVFRKKVWINPEGNETLHIIWETLYPYDKINSNYTKEDWKQIKQKIIDYCESPLPYWEREYPEPEKLLRKYGKL